MKADAVAVAKENGTPRDDEVRSIIERTQSGYMENTLFLRNLWYFALPSDKLKKRQASNQRSARRENRLWKRF